MATRICINCNKKFSNIYIYKGKRRIYTHNRHYCFKCLPPYHNYQTTFTLIGKKLRCETCGRIYIYKRAGKTNNKVGGGGNWCTAQKCSRCVRGRRRKRVKRQCIDFMGGKCQKCGYNKCMGALTFHHRNPHTKKFEITSAFNRNILNFKRIKKELKKCIMLCSNCHAEEHERINNLNMEE